MLTVTVNDINLNHTTDTIWVTVHPNPIAEITAGDTVVCAGSRPSSSMPLSVAVQEFTTTYTWSGQTAPLSGTDITDPVFNSWLRGIYRLIFTVEDNNGCTATDSLSIFNDSPQSSFTSDALPGCSPVSVNFTNTSENACKLSMGFWRFNDEYTGAILYMYFQIQHRRYSISMFSLQP